MKLLKITIPDFAGQRKEWMKGFKYPAPMDVDQSGLAKETYSLEKLCTNLNEIVDAYKSSFLFNTDGYDDFKKLLLPLVLKLPNEKVLSKTLRTRWIEEQKITVGLTKGFLLKKEKQLEFLLDSLEFPKTLQSTIEKMAVALRGCFVPVNFKFADLYNKETSKFEMTEAVIEKLRDNYTIAAQDEKGAILHYLRYQLCDSLNALEKIGLGMNNSDVTRFVLRLLDVEPRDDFYVQNTFWVDARKLTSKQLPEVKIVEGTIRDLNTYDLDGKPVGKYEPIELKVLVNGISHDVRLPTPALIFQSTNSKNKIVMAHEIARTSTLLSELIYNESSIELLRQEEELAEQAK